MTNNLTLAKAELEKRNATLVLYDGKEWIFSLERGIKPLLLLYEQRKDLSAFVAADKVIGKAAAFLYILLGIKEIYANVISEGALCVFADYGISVEYEHKSRLISNRQNTDICPMEKAVLLITTPQEAYQAILKKYRELCLKS